jgi:phosphoribosylformimino-5-aminoimidazole carboxamide ribotide isomerase
VILLPAIDIRGGKAVRLTQGDYERETEYDEDPLAAAERWAGEGAEWLHVVDLDGAREGNPVNLDHVWRMAEGVAAPIQIGGGLRDKRAVDDALDVGAERIVLGTAAIRDPQFLDEMLEAHGDRVVVSVDARAGKVTVEGWTEGTDTPAAELLGELGKRGVSRFVFTPIDVDGTMEGPDLEALREAATATDSELLYSGGIGSLEDLRALAGLKLPNLGGVIVGKALYEERFTVADAKSALAGLDVA